MKTRKRMIPFLVAIIALSGMLPGIGKPQTVQAEAAAEVTGQPANEASYIDGYYKNVGWTDNNMFTTETLNYRMNYDLDVSKTTTLALGVSGFLEKQNFPGLNDQNIWYSLIGQSPVSIPFMEVPEAARVTIRVRCCSYNRYRE